MSRRIESPVARRSLIAVALASSVAACMPKAVDPPKPQLDMPTAWETAAPEGRTVTVANWWSVYGDPTLERLVEEALARSQSLAEAIARVDEARALVDIVEADRLPTVDLNTAASRTRSSRRVGAQPGMPIEQNNYRLAARAFYEIDLWDRLRNASEAARAELLAAEASRDTVRVAVAAAVAQSYFALRALDLQIDVARRSIDVREESLQLQRKRVEAGVLAELDLRQIEAELAAVRAQLAPLEGLRAREEAALAVLLGRSPREILGTVVEQRREAPLEVMTPVVPAGLPSELLLRRPDIVEAERLLAAANLRVAIARTGHFPSIALTGYLGTESAALGHLFSGPAGIWQLAAALTQPIFAGGRLEAEVEAASARERQALARYQGVIQAAFRDVRSALASQTQARAAYDAEQARVAALLENVRLARLRYLGGLSSQLELLDAERNLLAAELNRIEALRAQRAAVASLLQALGGGWDERPPAPAKAR